MTALAELRQVDLEDIASSHGADVPVGVAALAKGWSRERMARAVQSGRVDGSFRHGRWWVSQAALARLLAEDQEKIAAHT